MHGPRRDDAPSADAGVDFLSGGGETGALIRARDWSSTPIGPIERWPQSLRTALSMVLHSPVPIVMLWGPEGVMLYNDAYSVFAEGRHPALLGSNVREGWPEVADFNDNVMKVGLAGGTLSYRNQELTLYRKGRPEQVWMNLDYSPVFDEAGRPAGVVAVVIETTEQVQAEAALKAERDRARDVLEGMADGFLLLGHDFTILEINAEGVRVDGRPRDAFIGRSHWEVWPDTYGTELGEAYRQAMADRRPFGIENRYVFADGRERWLDVRGYPVTEGLALFYRDITDQKAAALRLILSEESLRLSTEAAEIGTWDLDLTTGVLTWSDRTRAAFGISPGTPVTMDDFYAALHPDDREATAQAFAAAVDPELRAAYDVDYRTVGKEDGVARWVSAKGRGIFEGDRCVRAIGTAIDITARKEAEQHLRLMVNELNHRVKNSLATVQAIAAQTLRREEIAAPVREALTSRLLALARAHDVLTDEKWAGASLSELALQAAEPYGRERFQIEGPPVTLPPRTAIAVALAFHELATNAAKYGALSNPGGCVRIAWSVQGGVADPRLALTWSESGGPAVAPPSRRGFGTRLIERALAAEFSGDVELTYPAEGVVCRISAALPRPAEADVWKNFPLLGGVGAA